MLYLKGKRIKNPVLLSLLLLTFLACQKEINTIDDIHRYFPANTALVIQTQDLTGLTEEINDLPLFKSNPSLIPGGLNRHITSFSKLTTPGFSYLYFSEDGEGPNFSYISRDRPGMPNNDSLVKIDTETPLFEGHTVHRYEFEDFTTFAARHNGIFLASNSLAQLKELLLSGRKNSPVDPVLTKAIAAADHQRTSLFVNHTHFDEFFRDALPGSSLPLTSLARWAVLDIDVSDSGILLNGITVSNTEDNMLLDVFTGTGAHPNETAKVTPASAPGFYSFTYGNFDLMHSNLGSYDKNRQNLPGDHLLNFTREAGFITWQNNNYYILRTVDRELANDALLPGEVIKEFRGVTIYKSEENKALLDPLSPLIHIDDPSHYVWLEDFLIFSSSAEALEGMITHFLNKTTFWEQEAYTASMQHLAAASSFLLVSNSAEIATSLQAASANEYKEQAEKLNLKDYPMMALQFVREKDFSHVHGVLSTTQNKTGRTLAQKLSVETGAQPATPAFPVKNHNSGEIEIAVQDQDNTLYLFSSEGNQLWTLSLESRIIGEIHQVDLFKNGNLQLAFTTGYALHIIDRNGKPVKPFPLQFRDEITRPLSIYDYDNNHNYRFVITQDRDVLMYDSKGRPVKGFDYKKVETAIINPPKHIRLNNKDYIVVPEESGKLNILSRQGSHRIRVKEKIDPSVNHWYDHNNSFVSLTASGELAVVDENGNVKRESATINSNARLVAQEGVLVTLSENILTINNDPITLDFGLYTDPEIFIANNTTYIAVTDTQAQRVYIFDKDGDLLPGFPVYGTSGIKLAADQSGNTLFTVRGEENRILLYSF